MSKAVAKLPTVARLLLGLVFLVFGLNGLLNFFPMPPLPPAAGQLVGAMVASYLGVFEKLTEIAVGALLLAGLFVPLALTVLAPIMLNIVAFHLFLAPSGLGMPLVLLVLHAYLAWAYRSAFAPMLRAQVSPDASGAGGASARAAA